MEQLIIVDGKEITITNPDKLIWSDEGITKLDYIQYLIKVSQYLLAYTTDRLLMTWHYPNGIGTERKEQKSIPENAPEWIPRARYKDREWILLNDAATLAWLANRYALEFHVPFDKYDHRNHPTDLVFDLDPMDGSFESAVKVAIQLKGVLDSLGLYSIPKTSGGTGIHVFVPIQPRYSFEEARQVNEFIARYMVELYPNDITVERVVNKRGKKLYFDYLQLWKMRTLPAPYSVRARSGATVSTPVSWEEVERGFQPADFTLFTVVDRIRSGGDLFSPVTTDKKNQNIDQILDFLSVHT